MARAWKAPSPGSSARSAGANNGAAVAGASLGAWSTPYRAPGAAGGMPCDGRLPEPAGGAVCVDLESKH